MNLLDKIIEELKQKAITKNIPYDAFIYQECIGANVLQIGEEAETRI